MNGYVLRVKEYLFRIKELVLVFIIGFVLTLWLFLDNTAYYPFEGKYVLNSETGLIIVLLWPVMFVLMIVIQFLIEPKR